MICLKTTSERTGKRTCFPLQADRRRIRRPHIAHIVVRIHRFSTDDVQQARAMYVRDPLEAVHATARELAEQAESRHFER